MAVQSTWPSLAVLLVLLLQSVSSQLIDSANIQENSEIGTVVYDLRERLLQILPTDSLANVTAYAGQQDLFWPFALKDLRVVVSRPLDREAICARQKQSFQSEDSRSQYSKTHLNGWPNGECPAQDCCQLLHINVVAGPTSPTRVVFVRVAVQDVNDNAPKFPHVETPFANILEDVAIGTRIFLPEAADADSKAFGVVEYRIAKWIQGNSSHFQLDLLSGFEPSKEGEIVSTTEFGGLNSRPFLTVVTPLDRETEEIYEFILEAVDGGSILSTRDQSPPRAFTGVTTIVLRIKDINDNAPVFDRSKYTADVQENTLPQKVIQFKVSDLDSGENGRVFVNIVDPTNRANNLFRVVLRPSQSLASDHGVKYQGMNSIYSKPHGSHYTGYLHLLDYLDAESLPSQLRFYITASDNGRPPLTSKVEVIVRILNVNDQAPSIVFLQEGKRLTESRLTLPEVLTLPGSIVAEVHVTDADTSLSQLTCRITREADTFSLLEVTALNRANNELGDGAEGEGFGRPTVPFLFSTYRQFSLRTKINLDRELRAAYLVTLMCSDNEVTSPLSKNSSLHVSISDVNDETPIFEHMTYTGHVKENSANGEVILIPPLRAIDSDVGRNAAITYTIRPISGHNATKTVSSPASEIVSGASTFHPNLFRIDPRSGKIWTTAELDCESVDHFQFLVIATDDGLPEKRSSSATVSVIVDDINDNLPEFDQYHYHFEVEENSPSGKTIGKVSIHDADRTEENRRVRYSLRGRPEDLFLVEIDRATGEISMRRPVDYERQSSLSFTVVAENESPVFHFSRNPSTDFNSHKPSGSQLPLSGRLRNYHSYTAEASIVISILNVNDNRPEFVPLSPHQKHVAFLWEQLPNVDVPVTIGILGAVSENSSVTDGSKPMNLGSQNICEPIPYRVIDKDWDPSSQEFCCSLILEHTFDGMFALANDMPNVLCALKRPLHPQSYKLTLVARDGNDNTSLSSQIQLSVIIKSGPEYNNFVSKPPILGLAAKNLQPSLQKPDGFYESSEDAGRLGSGSFERQKISSNSSYQMKIISILVSIAGIFCILLLFVIVALKCGVFDGQHFFFAKTTDGNERNNHLHAVSGTGLGVCSGGEASSGTGLGLATFKPEVTTLQHPVHGRIDDYRTLGECFPDELFYVESKGTTTQKRPHNSREGAYEISSNLFSLAANTMQGSPRSNAYSGGIIMANEVSPNGSRYLTPFSAGTFSTNHPVAISPKLLRGCSSIPKASPFLVATLYPPHPGENTQLSSSAQQSTYKIPGGANAGRIMSVNMPTFVDEIPSNTHFYTTPNAYQALDPSTIHTKSTHHVGAGQRQKETPDSKVTFNLEMISVDSEPGGQAADDELDITGDTGMKRLLKNNISKTSDGGVTLSDDQITKEHRCLGAVMYNKASTHSSFV